MPGRGHPTNKANSGPDLAIRFSRGRAKKGLPLQKNVQTNGEIMKTTTSILRVAARALALTLFVALAMPAQAELIGTDEALAAESRVADSATVMQFLTREDVAERMQAFGVAPELAQERVAMLSDEELRHLSERIDSDPAGAGVIEILGITFLVLLVLEFVGVINIFNA